MTIDEVQRTPNFFISIKEEVDKSNDKGQVWLTSSQKFSLLRGVAESLSGRMVDFELLPLSLYERQFLAHEQIPFVPSDTPKNRVLHTQSDKELWQIIWSGSWPALVDMGEQERNWFFEGLLQSYLERDIHLFSGVQKLDDFEKFLRILAGRTGQELKIYAIAKEAQISPDTLKNCLSAARTSGIIYYLPPFYENVSKVVIKSPKIYFTDTGLACYLVGLNSVDSLMNYYQRGAIFENFVLMEIYKSYVHNGIKPEFFFYRDSRQNEIDLLIRKGVTYYPVEIKMTHHPEAKMVSNFAVIRRPNIATGPGALGCLTSEPRFLNSQCRAISVRDL